MLSAHYRRLRRRLDREPRTWLVTGAAGFIGSNLVEELLDLGQVVVGLDNFSTGHRANIDEVLADRPAAAARFTLIEGDIRDPETCRGACRGVDYLLHHAALGSVPWSLADPRTTTEVNVTGFVNMLIAAKEAGVSRVVFASSSAVYGDTEVHPQVEERVGQPLSPYAASKTTNETYALAFQRSYGIESIGLRYFNVFGRRQDPAGAYAAVIPRWIDSLLHDEQCTIYGDGDTTRDFCYVANVVQANLLAATAGARATAQSYNVACAESVTLNQLFHMLRGQLAVHEPRLSRVQPRYEAFRKGDIRYSRAAITKARHVLAFSPTHPVDAGLADALPWYIRQSRSTLSVPRSRVTAPWSAYDFHPVRERSTTDRQTLENRHA